MLATGQLTEGGAYDVDFDHQFLEADKYDSKRTYKGFDGYSPGVFTIGGLIAYLENRDGFEYNELEGKGLYGLAGKLTIQPEYQRNYIYADGKKDVAVIRSIP